MILRSYQHETVAGAKRQLVAQGSSLAVLATGLGKTVIFCELARQCTSGRVMVMAHRDELIRQAADKVDHIVGERPEIEKADEFADKHVFRRTKVVVSSVQSLNAKHRGAPRMQRFNPMDFAGLIIDEAHHAASPSYRRVVNWFKKNEACWVFGVTATPHRLDKQALGKVFNSVAFNYGIDAAVRDGWLVPVRQLFGGVISVNYNGIGSGGGDFKAGELESAMIEEKPLHGVKQGIFDAVAERRCIVFTSGVRHAELLSDIINREDGGSADWISGKTKKDDRAAKLAAFSRGDIKRLCNVGVLTEGFDDPGVDGIVMARPTQSLALYTQMIGRGTRPLPGIVDAYDTANERKAAIGFSDKSDVKVLDFHGNGGNHKLITVSDALGGEYEDKVRERAKKIAEQQGDRDMSIVLDEAKAQIEEEERIALQRRQGLTARAEIEYREIDPFDAFDLAPPRADNRYVKAPTDKMVARLKMFGVKNPERLSRGDAGRLIGKMKQNEAQDGATYNQIRRAQQLGRDVRGMSKYEASRVISAAIENPNATREWVA